MLLTAEPFLLRKRAPIIKMPPNSEEDRESLSSQQSDEDDRNENEIEYYSSEYDSDDYDSDDSGSDSGDSAAPLEELEKGASDEEEDNVQGPVELTESEGEEEAAARHANPGQQAPELEPELEHSRSALAVGFYSDANCRKTQIKMTG